MVVGKNLKHIEITECVLNMILTHDVVISSTAITYASIVSHSPPRAEVKNEWRYNCFPPIYIYIYIYAFVLWTGKNCTYYYCNLSSHWLTTKSSPLSPVALIGQSLQQSYVIGLRPHNHFGSYLNIIQSP